VAWLSQQLNYFRRKFIKVGSLPLPRQFSRKGKVRGFKNCFDDNFFADIIEKYAKVDD